ncbi:helicase related [Anaeramoeba flamelloides]|uniref:Helicase related n=1 Tax=Anaeramoeba flamelloides TaxID=1746091 RepID=A0AAV7Z8Z7_9EUKA|nr:helicase related [Anaeramoeba flamelloides]
MIYHKKLIRDYCTCCIFTLVFFFVTLFSVLTYPGTVTPINKTNTWADGEGNTTDGSFWFFHISDTHSQASFNDSNDNFKEVLAVADDLDPLFIINTGDLSEGCPDLDGIGLCYEDKKNWEAYKGVMEEFNVFDKESVGTWNDFDRNAPFILDIRGERDVYSVLKDSSTDNYYYPYGSLGSRFQSDNRRKVNRFTYDLSYGKYEIITTDLQEEPMLSFPFGYYNTPIQERLDLFEDELISAKESDPSSIIVATHHPTALITDNYHSSKTGKTFRQLLKDYDVELLLVGHLHTVGWNGIILGQTDGVIELGASSIRFNAMFDFIVYDNDLISWKQVLTKDLDSPLIFITNPPNAQFLTSHQPINKIAKSKYLRVMTFDQHLGEKSKVSKVTATITIQGSDKKDTFELSRSDASQPLWIKEWDPSKYSESELNTIEVTVECKNGDKLKESHKFSTVGKQDQIIGSFNRYYQQLNSYAFLLSSFIVLYIFLVIFLLFGTKIVRHVFFTKEKFENLSIEMGNLVVSSKLKETSLLKILKYHFTFNLWKYSLFSNTAFIIFTISGLSLLILPMAIGPMIKPGIWGASLLYGIRSNGSFQFELNNFTYASLFLACVYWPFLNIISKNTVKKNIHNSIFEKKKYLIFKPSFWVALIGFFITVIFSWTQLMHYEMLGILLSMNIFWNSLFLLIYLIIVIIKDFKKSKNITINLHDENDLDNNNEALLQLEDKESTTSEDI